MHIPTIYSEEFDGSTNFVISRDKLHHLVNVLRIKKGNEVKVSNGQGLLAQGILNENQSLGYGLSLQGNQ